MKLTTDTLRQKFLRFFESHEHKIYPSDSLVPKDDPTLLFTSAGMNQFKQEFLGKPTRFRRCATCQKCLRTDDLDKVGKTNFHHTFFEMLGNFSFGDYFKKEAIKLAWEFVTEELKLPKDRLWVSVYREDEESYKIWKDEIKIKQEKIIKLGAKENFWPSNAPIDGPNGPCGPCSEIFYDRGKEFGCRGPQCNPACDCGRFVETWNLVFTQFDRKKKNVLEPLPNKNIDTGMGLERMACVLQGVTSNFEIDIFKPIINEVMRLSPLSNKDLDNSQYSARNAIVDHIRAVTFAISEGVLPSNDERGYVVRKLIRRTVWHGRNLGIKKPYLYKIVPSVVRVMKPAYPEMEEKREDIAQVVLAEEKRFHKTLERAIALCRDMIAELKKEGKSKIPKELAFKLYDTYGLPQEMLEVLAHQESFELDKEGLMQELETQRRASRQASLMKKGVFVGTLASKFRLKPTKFIGDKNYSAKTKICALFKDERPLKQARVGERIKIVLESSPFYAESGGQIGDAGIIRNKDVKIKVFDTQKIDQTHIHSGEVTDGTVRVGDKVEAGIDVERRKNIARNHTATHLLQAALRKALGAHVRQAGSWVGPEYLRFDFTHFQALTEREISRTEELVNRYIQKDIRLKVLKTDFEQAQKMGALAFFGEKYEEKVRVLKIGGISLELCGGTHVSSTGEIGIFKIISEFSVASGIRRIEAVTAEKARQVIKEKENELQELARTFNISQDNLPECIQRLQYKIRQLDKELDKSGIENFKANIDSIISDANEIAGVKVIIRKLKGADMKMLRLMADVLRQKVSPSVVLLVSLWEKKIFMVCATSPNLRHRRVLDAVKIIRVATKYVQGSGGGRVDFAQAGGSSIEGIEKALGEAEKVIKKELEL